MSPNPDARVRPGETYAQYCERRGVAAVDPGERPIPTDPLVLPSSPGAWRPERPADPRDRAAEIAYYTARGEPMPTWAIAELPMPDPRDAQLAELKQQLAELRSELRADLESVGSAVVKLERAKRKRGKRRRAAP